MGSAVSLDRRERGESVGVAGGGLFGSACRRRIGLRLAVASIGLAARVGGGAESSDRRAVNGSVLGASSPSGRSGPPDQQAVDASIFGRWLRQLVWRSGSVALSVLNSGWRCIDPLGRRRVFSAPALSVVLRSGSKTRPIPARTPGPGKSPSSFSSLLCVLHAQCVPHRWNGMVACIGRKHKGDVSFRVAGFQHLHEVIQRDGAVMELANSTE